MAVDGDYEVIMALIKFKAIYLPTETNIKKLSLWFQGRAIYTNKKFSDIF